MIKKGMIYTLLDGNLFITAIYGDLTEYLLNRIEAEVRNQKLAVTQ